ncbi:hypothetical protein HA402_001607 [Bradysia odoriphaga]|nr:hypothetical protein HA402_001607 [Bradysia odoriphaga]
MVFLQATGESTANDLTLPRAAGNSDGNIRHRFVSKFLLVDSHVTDGGKRRRKQTAKVKKATKAKKEQRKLKEALERHLAEEEEEKNRYREAKIIYRGIERIAKARPGDTAVVSAPTEQNYHKIVGYRPRRINFDVSEE